MSEKEELAKLAKRKRQIENKYAKLAKRRLNKLNKYRFVFHMLLKC